MCTKVLHHGKYIVTFETRCFFQTFVSCSPSSLLLRASYILLRAVPKRSARHRRGHFGTVVFCFRRVHQYCTIREAVCFICSQIFDLFSNPVGPLCSRHHKLRKESALPHSLLSTYCISISLATPLTKITNS